MQVENSRRDEAAWHHKLHPSQKRNNLLPNYLDTTTLVTTFHCQLVLLRTVVALALKKSEGATVKTTQILEASSEASLNTAAAQLEVLDGMMKGGGSKRIRMNEG